jgi:hypothetical protein
MTIMNKKAAALLMVLMLIVIISSSTHIALLQWRRANDVHQNYTHDQYLNTILNDSIAWSSAYLTEHPDKLVFPADENIYGLPLKNDAIQFLDIQGTLQITAYDATAAIPAHLAGIGKPLHKALPDEFHGLSLKSFKDKDPALIWTQSAVSTLAMRFPKTHSHQEFELWGHSTDNNPSNSPQLENHGPALACHINPYNKNQININTCSLPVLELLYKKAGIENDLGDLIEARTNLEISTAPKIPNNKSLPVKFTDKSGLFSLHITITWLSITRDYWVNIQTGDAMELKQILGIGSESQ